MTWDIVGQTQAVSVLQRAVEDEARLSHTYLFAGPEQVGRATVARRFAQALNCEATAQPGLGGVAVEDARPCSACRQCRLIAEDKHPDVEWLRPGGLCDESEHKDHEGSRDIRICQVRRIERVISRTAVDARKRVIVVEPAEALTPDAANAFLKTLEEPAPNTVLVLITAREEAVPQTVRSRCRRIPFRGVPRKELEEALRKHWGAGEEQVAHLAGLAGGRLGWAVLAVQDERILIERDRVLEEVESVVLGKLEKRFSYAASLGSRYSKDAGYVRARLDAWENWWREVLLAAAGSQSGPADERLDSARAQAAQWGVRGAIQALRSVKLGRQHLEERASPALALEVMLLDLPSLARSGS
jgi:DNA polymerase-3 subunit delta'